MSRGYPHGKKPWSKFQKQIYNLFDPELNLQMRCTVYAISTKFDTFESPRHWITLDKEIISDFPSYFLSWKHLDASKPLTHIDEAYLGARNGIIAQLLHQCMNIPKESLFTTSFPDDNLNLINIPRVADRRVGKIDLRTLANTVSKYEPAMKVLAKRLNIEIITI